MSLRLAELQKLIKKAQKIRAEGLDEYENVNGVLYYQELPFILEIIQTKLISRSYDNCLVGSFDINKTKELIGKKYYWPSLRKDVKAYVKGCDVCLASKTVKHKPYSNLQSLLIPTH